MTKKQKLIRRFLSMPSDFHYNEMVQLLKYYKFHPRKKGKTSGSRIKFENPEGILVIMHKPHPGGIMKRYQLKQVKEILGL